jgi:hypothetical protein
VVVGQFDRRSHFPFLLRYLMHYNTGMHDLANKKKEQKLKTMQNAK